MLVSISDNANLDEAIEVISKQPNVEFVEPLYIVKAFGPENSITVAEAAYETVTDAVYGPDDPYYIKKWQWGLQAINVTDIWERVPVEKRKNVTIAVVDTGVDLEHPDLKDSIVAGYDFINQDNVPDDDNGHGTHVAGIAAAITNNGIGIAGVAGGAKIMPVKVLSAEGYGSSLDVYLGIMYAADHGADVINLSLGSDAPSLLINEAVKYALARDVVVVAATGNEYSDTVSYPAGFDGVIGVGAVDWNYPNGFIRADFSNYGEGTDIVAPGVDILSTYPEELDIADGNQDGYTILDGTSMATPFVAGMAALLRAEHPEWSYEEIQKALQENAYDIYQKGPDKYTGAGVVNGSTGKITVPEIIEFPNVALSVSRTLDNPYSFKNNKFNIKVEVQKAKGFVDETFNGTVSVIPNLYLSSPVSGYLSDYENTDSNQSILLKSPNAQVLPTKPLKLRLQTVPERLLTPANQAHITLPSHPTFFSAVL
ncbi:S8 family peptidase [Thermoclostridium stercorarium]|uniref:S8 family peptidase n=1 Tax=Thermoclostridium stercorarium TaxID=1510 RepID=UPI000ACC59BA|nr:S8 family peptidase [Thermoclostridium stercorarium]